MLEPCGSKSINAGRYPQAAKLAARVVASVVLPAPPFGFKTRILCISLAVAAVLVRVEKIQVPTYNKSNPFVSTSFVF